MGASKVPSSHEFPVRSLCLRRSFRRPGFFFARPMTRLRPVLRDGPFAVSYFFSSLDPASLDVETAVINSSSDI